MTIAATTPTTPIVSTRAWPKKASEAILAWNLVKFFVIARRSLLGIDL